jgi:hypothetical protein
VGECSLLDRVAIKTGQSGQPSGQGGATAASLLQLADVGLDVATVHSQQPDTDLCAPGAEVSQVGQVGGARVVSVAEQELVDQALARLAIDQ